jgi:hypothetical protein
MFEHGIAPHARHHHIENDQVRPLLVNGLFALLAVARLDNPETFPFQDEAQSIAQFVVIVHNQDRLGLRHFASPRMGEK